MLPSRQCFGGYDPARHQVHLRLQQHPQAILSCHHGRDFFVADHRACGSLVIGRDVYAPRVPLGKACAVRAQKEAHWDMSIHYRLTAMRRP
ncbi:hypothetical protein G6F22_022083 [Rhizopus arrhizus]|nr:hypothetical protein G6F22_022083 [Rhizopus arrhizus]